MAASIRELRDPYGWALAVLALLANLIMQAAVFKAVLVALAVLVVKVGAGALWPRPTPPAPPAPAVEPPRRRGPAIPGSKLTAREIEVAALIPEGLTNRQIGYRLRPQVQESGVDHHVLNIMNKLSVHSRAEIAAWYTRQKGTDKT
jgi:DNA-binding CsgD family transcriptional regulator